MAIGSTRSRIGDGSIGRWMILAGAILACLTTLSGVILAPLVLNHLYPDGEDYSQASEIGQAYGAVSAVISVLALAGVIISLLIQRRQHIDSLLHSLIDSTEALTRLAMEDPAYQQCWGSRVAPEEIDERLFAYCNQILNTWKRAWALEELSEAQARSYLAVFFDSEVPRAFWRAHGNLHEKVKYTSQRMRFLSIINDEYYRADKTGPPSRSYEGAPGRHSQQRNHRGSSTSVRSVFQNLTKRPRRR